MNVFWRFVKKIYFKVLWEIGVTEDTERSAEKLRNLGFKIGKDVFLDHVEVEEIYPEFLEIENNVTIAYGTRILLHDSSMNNLFGDPVRFGKVVIKEGAYIGSRCIIMPGVTIGKKSIVGAGSLVTKDVKDETIVMGTPAKEYMKVSEYRERFLANIGKDKYYYWNIDPFMERLKDKDWYEKEKKSYKNFIKKNKLDN
jgi:acetyltransferase-like isoleucine patch superfamily enzyme